jgi:hypothetical protein
MCDGIADADPRPGERFPQGLGIGVADDEADTGKGASRPSRHAGVRHTVDGVATTPADPDHDDRSRLRVTAAAEQPWHGEKDANHEQPGQQEDDRLEEGLGGLVHGPSLGCAMARPSTKYVLRWVIHSS